MNQQINEQLSALMDGRLDGEQARFVLARAKDGEDVRQRWSRYHYAAQVLRGEHPLLLRDGFAESVMRSIEPPARSGSHFARRVVRWGAGGAIAATVAVAALVVTRPVGEMPVSAPMALTQGNASPGVSGPAIAVAPAAATTTTYGAGEIRPPLLAPGLPLDAAPASYGMETVLVPTLDPRFGAYARRTQPTQSANAPYVLLLTPQQSAREPSGQH